MTYALVFIFGVLSGIGVSFIAYAIWLLYNLRRAAF